MTIEQAVARLGLSDKMVGLHDAVRKSCMLVKKLGDTTMLPILPLALNKPANVLYGQTGSRLLNLGEGQRLSMIPTEDMDVEEGLKEQLNEWQRLWQEGRVGFKEVLKLKEDDEEYPEDSSDQ